MRELDISIVHYFDKPGPIAEIYCDSILWAEVENKEQNDFVRFFCDVKSLSANLDQVLELLKQAGKRIKSKKPTCATSVNTQAKKIIEQILHHPNRTLHPYKHGRFGDIVDICDPTKKGIRYNTEQEFLGLLESYHSIDEDFENGFRIVIASLPDRERVVAEIFYLGVQWVEISHEDKSLTIQFYPHDKNPWIFDLELALNMIHRAKQFYLGQKIESKFTCNRQMIKGERFCELFYDQEKWAEIHGNSKNVELKILHPESSDFWEFQLKPTINILSQAQKDFLI